MVSQQVLEGHWDELKGQIQDTWGSVTEDDLQELKGDFNQVIGVIKRKTGQTRENIERQLNDLLKECSTMTERGAAAAREYAGAAASGAQEAYDAASEQLRRQYAATESMVQNRPLESVAVAFGTGLIAGVIAGLVIRSR